jgi:hypothetical protein
LLKHAVISDDVEERDDELQMPLWHACPPGQSVISSQKIIEEDEDLLDDEKPNGLNDDDLEEDLFEEEKPNGLDDDDLDEDRLLAEVDGS